MNERGRRGLPEEPVSRSLSEVRALLRDEADTSGATRGASQGAFGVRADEPQGVGAELRDVLSSAPSGADLDAERRARWAEEVRPVMAPRARLGRGGIAAVVALFAATAAATLWCVRRPTDEHGGSGVQAAGAEMTTPSAPVTAAASAVVSVAPSEVNTAPSASVAAPKSAATVPAKAPKKRPQRRNVDRQFDDVLDRL